MIPSQVPYLPPLYAGTHKPGIVKVNPGWAYVPPVRPHFKLNLDREETTSDTGVTLEEADAWRRERFPIQRTNRFPSKLIEKELAETIADRNRLVPDNVVIGNGVMSLMTYIYDIYLSIGKNVVVPTPGFWPAYTYAMQRARGILMPLYDHRQEGQRPAYYFPFSAVRDALKASVALCYISNPNNPTGTLIPGALIARLIQDHPQTLFVVDEAYGPFAAAQLGLEEFELSEMLDLIREGVPNLIVARTFSKVYAMANFRVGYLISHRANIETIRAHMGPYDMDEISLAIALYNYTHDAYAKEVVAAVRDHKRIYEETLDRAGVVHYSGFRNSLLVEGLDLSEEYEKRGIAVRSMIYQEGIPNPIKSTFRITVPSDKQNLEFLLRTTAEILTT